MGPCVKCLHVIWAARETLCGDYKVASRATFDSSRLPLHPGAVCVLSRLLVWRMGPFFSFLLFSCFFLD
jgi:hypothetical protein